MQIAVLTFDGFNEIDSFVALNILSRLRPKGWRAFITAPDEFVTSMNGVAVRAERGLDFIPEADAVIVGSGVKSADLATDAALMSRLQLDPERQLIASQCSGALLLKELGLIRDRPVSTDLSTRQMLAKAGVSVIDRPFHADGNIATAGGCLASQYLAAWIIMRAGSREDAEMALGRVAPVGEQAAYVARAIEAIKPYLPVPVPAVASAA